MMTDIGGRITDRAGLRELYRPPSSVVTSKMFSSIDRATAAFIDRCPFLVIGTTDGSESVDASPRGGPPGFIRRLDDRHLAIPDLNGNNRLNSLENIVEHGWAGLLLVIPGKEETVRINGPAILTIDDEILDGFTTELRRPKLAIVVETKEVYGHCAKAFRRGGMWDTEAWARLDDAPDLADIVTEQFGMPIEDSRQRLRDAYQVDLALD